MTHDITHILSVCCAQYGTSAKRVLGGSLHSDRVEKSKALFIYITDVMQCPSGRCGALIGWDSTDTKANIMTARTKYKADLNFKRRADAVLEMFHIKADTAHAKDCHSRKKRDSYYTKEEEKSMREACTEALRFMESYGLPRDDGSIRYAVTNGVGYYPQPMTFDK